MVAAIEPTLAAALDRKMALRGKVEYAPTDVSHIAEQLNHFLTAQVGEAFEVRNLNALSGGASMEQYVFDLYRPNADRQLVKMILRMSPLCSVIETCRLREFQIIRAVAGVLPAPEAFWVSDSDEYFGRPALICSFNPGVASPKDGGGKATGLGTVYGKHREKLAPQYVRYLAALHTMDWRDKDLSALVIPREGTSDAVDWSLAHWDRVWEEDAVEAHPTVALARAWLWRNRPVVDHISLVHGDYRNGNFLFDEDTDEITVILDWEAGYLGDRHMDLAYAMLPGYGTVVDGTYYCAGLVEKNAFIAEYSRLSGLSVDPARLRYYTVLNMYWAIIACCATSPKLAADRMTHLDTMMNIVPGLGFYFVNELNAILLEEQQHDADG
jgi:aminoglycoside phosphotransferase (APT) family kinase protein